MQKTKPGGRVAAFVIAAVTGIALATGAVAQGKMSRLAERGKALFEDVGGAGGCANCHGISGTGDPLAGGTYIRGVSISVFNAALNGGVPEMDYLELNNGQKRALFAYLQYLYTAPEALIDPVALPGQVIFEETAGGVGCQTCHGMDARGDHGPDIRGRSAADIREALGRVEDMEFIELTKDEIEQVSIYLTYLLEAAQN